MVSAPSYDSSCLWMNSSNMHCKLGYFISRQLHALWHNLPTTWTLCMQSFKCNHFTCINSLSLTYCFCSCRCAYLKGTCIYVSWLNAIAVSVLCKIYILIHKKCKKCTWNFTSGWVSAIYSCLNLLPQSCCPGIHKVKWECKSLENQNNLKYINKQWPSEHVRESLNCMHACMHFIKMMEPCSQYSYSSILHSYSLYRSHYSYLSGYLMYSLLPM